MYVRDIIMQDIQVQHCSLNSIIGTCLAIICNTLGLYVYIRAVTNTSF